MSDRSRLCAFPFRALESNVDGKFKVCCKFEGTISNSDGVEYSISEHSLKEVFSSPYMADVRNDFLEGRSRTECVACHRQEAAGSESLRNIGLSWRWPSFLENSEELSPRLTSLSLTLSSKCNLRCRICSSFHSSSWASEDTQFDGDSKYTDHKSKTFLNSSQKQVDFVNTLNELTNLEISGGEPMLIDEFEQILDLCIKTKRAPHVELFFNTNCTVWNPRVIEKLKQFKTVHMGLSIDDVENRFEYERHGAKWERVVRNIERYKEFGSRPNIHIKFCPTVSIFNVIYLDQLVQFFNLHKEFEFYFNFLSQPQILALTNLPSKISEKFLENFSMKKMSKSLLFTLSNDGEAIIEMLKSSSSELDPWKLKFDSFIQAIDKRRAENFAITFPELENIFKEASAIDSAAVLY